MNVCDLCDYHTIYKSNYMKHLKTNKHQKMLRNEKDFRSKRQIMALSNMTEDETLICKYCMCKFRHKSSLSKHIKYTCTKNEDEDLKELVRLLNLQLEQQRKQNESQMDEYRNHIESQQRQITKLTEKLQVPQQINNNCNNKTINVRVSYKDTDISHITNKDYQNIINTTNMCVKNLIEKAHFDIEHPENMNIYISNMKDKYIMVYTDGNWELKYKKTELQDLYDTNEMRLEEWLNFYGTNELRKTFAKYTENKKKEDVIKMINEEIKLMMYNKRNLIENNN